MQRNLMKTPLALGFLLAVLAGLRISAVAADEPKAKPPGAAVKLGKIPDVKLALRPAVDPARVKHVKGLIADLAKLGGPGVGLSATLSGHDFAPVPGQAQAGVLLLTDHRVKESQALRELVAFGPDALPLLLDALEDGTPTRITIRHEGFLGGMWYGGELGLNPVNPAEAAVYKARAEARGRGGEREEQADILDSYTVKIGDVCFVAIGQIVGRAYSAVRYQPTACIVINSPTHDAKLRADVRAAWAGKDPTRRLLDSLLADYAIEGVFNGRTLDGWGAGSRLQCGAALRLLYYFPKEAAGLVSGRLDSLDVGPGEYMTRAVANRVRAEEFVKAVAWCEEPVVRAAVVNVFKRAEHYGSLMAALPAVEDKALIRGRLEPMLDRAVVDKTTAGSPLLRALAERTPDTAEAVFRKYLRDPTWEQCREACWALRGVAVPWDATVLGPLLGDKRETNYQYDANPGGSGPRLYIRVCDEAARVLVHNHPKLTFKLVGEHADLDKQIAVMREQLNRKN